MEGMRKKAFTSVIWASVETAGVRLINLLSFLVLARILAKEDFGVLALASVYIAFLELVVRAGITDVIVQHDDLSELHKDTAFWSTAILGVMAMVGSTMLAPVAASWSGEVIIEPVVNWLALGIIPLSLSRVQQGLLMRELDYRSLAFRRLISAASGAAVGITMALKGYGVWSLVAQQLVERVAEFLTLYSVTRWFPKFRFSWSAFSDLWAYASRIMAINILNFAGSNLDRFIIGQFFGVATLGVYFVGRRIIEVIQGIVRVVIGRVALSAFSRIQFDNERLFEGSAAMARIIALGGFPVMGLFIFFGQDITTVVFGDKWAEAGAICQIVAVGGIIQMSTLFTQPLLKAKGYPGSVLVANTAMFGTSIVFGLALASFGLNAFTVGWVSGNLVFGGLLLYSVKTIMDYPVAKVFKQYVGPVLALICGWLVTMYADPLFLQYLDHPLALLLARVILFLFCYAIFLPVFGLKTVKLAYSDISMISRGKKKPKAG
jgi:PST family polysaccharide transporter